MLKYGCVAQPLTPTSTFLVTIQQGVPRGLAGPLAGCGGPPPFSLTPPPEAAQEKGDQNSYLFIAKRIESEHKLAIFTEQLVINENFTTKTQIADHIPV